MKLFQEAVERMERACNEERERILQAHVGTGMDVAEVRESGVDGLAFTTTLRWFPIAPGDAPPAGTSVVYEVSKYSPERAA